MAGIVGQLCSAFEHRYRIGKSHQSTVFRYSVEIIVIKMELKIFELLRKKTNTIELAYAADPAIISNNIIIR
ncbi:hypothetical protein RP20_CCG009204 [Aedes albopictus]|nr:hypothetical protein RP20_CCG009204 [Aedes albopictus]